MKIETGNLVALAMFIKIYELLYMNVIRIYFSITFQRYDYEVNFENKKTRNSRKNHEGKIYKIESVF